MSFAYPKHVKCRLAHEPSNERRRRGASVPASRFSPNSLIGASADEFLHGSWVRWKEGRTAAFFGANPEFEKQPPAYGPCQALGLQDWAVGHIDAPANQTYPPPSKAKVSLQAYKVDSYEQKLRPRFSPTRACDSVVQKQVSFLLV